MGERKSARLHNLTNQGLTLDTYFPVKQKKSKTDKLPTSPLETQNSEQVPNPTRKGMSGLPRTPPPGLKENTPDLSEKPAGPSNTDQTLSNVVDKLALDAKEGSKTTNPGAETSNPPMDTPMEQEPGATMTDNEARIRAENDKKYLEMENDRQRYNLPGDHHRNISIGNEFASNTDVENYERTYTTGYLLNHMDSQQRRNYDIAYHVNRIEEEQNLKKLRITGHGFSDLSDKGRIYRWWKNIVLWEIEAPERYVEIGQGLIQITTPHFDSRGTSDRGNEEYRMNPINQAIILEFPSPAIVNWVLNAGVRNCWRLQEKEGLNRLSFSQVLTTFQVKVQQYAMGVISRMRNNLSDESGGRIAALNGVTMIRGIGKLKRHAILTDSEGRERKIYYNNLIIDPASKPFLPRDGEEVALPPTDFSYEPMDTPLMEVDFHAEAKYLGVKLQGKKEGISLRVPQYMPHSVRKRLAEGSFKVTAPIPMASGSNAVTPQASTANEIHVNPEVALVDNGQMTFTQPRSRPYRGGRPRRVTRSIQRGGVGRNIRNGQQEVDDYDQWQWGNGSQNQRGRARGNRPRAARGRGRPYKRGRSDYNVNEDYQNYTSDRGGNDYHEYNGAGQGHTNTVPRGGRGFRSKPSWPRGRGRTRRRNGRERGAGSTRGRYTPWEQESTGNQDFYEEGPGTSYSQDYY